MCIRDRLSNRAVQERAGGIEEFFAHISAKAHTNAGGYDGQSSFHTLQGYGLRTDGGSGQDPVCNFPGAELFIDQEKKLLTQQIYIQPWVLFTRSLLQAAGRCV